MNVKRLGGLRYPPATRNEIPPPPSPSRTPTKAHTKRPTKASTEVPTKVSSQVVEVHLSCFHLFCWSATRAWCRKIYEFSFEYFDSSLRAQTAKTLKYAKSAVSANFRSDPKGWFSKKVVFQKGGFGGCSPGTKTGTRVHSEVPRNEKLERGYVRMFPQNENRNEGTFTKTTLLENHPFVNPRISERAPKSA